MIDRSSPYLVPSADGTPIAVHRSGTSGAAPLVLIHGTTADHSTFRALAPALADTFELHAIDRRGRGASGDAAAYAIEREYDDVVAVAEAVAVAESSRPDAGRVDVFGHSYGGRCALGAALRTPVIRRVVCYEGAPTPPGRSYHPAGLDDELAALLDAGDLDTLLATFMRRVVGMSDEDLAAYRANPVWPLRVAAAPTIVRELAAEQDPAASLDALGAVRQPVLQLLGAASLPVFRDATSALDGRLADGRILEIPGAKHAAHHTHVDAVAEATRGFLRGSG